MIKFLILRSTRTRPGVVLAALLVSAPAIFGVVIPADRIVDWSKAGVPGGIPNRTTIYTTLNPGATAAQINAAIQACPSNQVVFLSAGTYNLTQPIVISKNGVTLRGAGPDKTFLNFAGASGSLITITGS